MPVIQLNRHDSLTVPSQGATAGVRTPTGVFVVALLALAMGFATDGAAQTFASAAREKDGAQPILDRAIEAMGGDDLVRKATTLVVTGSSSRATPAGMVKAPTKTYFVYPMAVRSETVIGGATVALVSTQDGAAMITEEGVVDLPESGRHNIERTALRNPFTLLKSRYGRVFSARAVGDAEIAGAPADLVEIVVGRNKMTIAVDRATGRLVQQAYETVGENDEKPVTIVVAYSDYRSLDGRGSYPFRARGTLGDKVVFESEIERMELNVPVEPSLLAAGSGQASAGARVLPR